MAADQSEQWRHAPFVSTADPQIGPVAQSHRAGDEVLNQSRPLSRRAVSLLALPGMAVDVAASKQKVDG